MYFQILIQILAVIGLIVWTTSYHFKDRKSILLVQLLSFVFWIAHFVLLGAVTGAVLSSIAAIRVGVFYFKTKNNWIGKPIVAWFFTLVLVIATYFTLTTYWAIFALIGGIFAVIASAQDKENRIRLLFIPSHLSWALYDIFIGSYGGAVSEGLLSLSALVSLLKKKS